MVATILVRRTGMPATLRRPARRPRPPTERSVVTAAATASLRRRCTSTLAGRSVRTRPGRARRLRRARRRPPRPTSSHGARGRAVGGGEAPRGRGRGACRTAARSASVGHATSACGRNEKMPPPSLSTTTTTRSMPRAGGAEQAVGVVEEGDVADEQRRGSAARRQRPRPTAVDTTPSMPLAPRLARTAHGLGRAATYHSTSRIGIDDDTTSVAAGGQGRDDRPGDAGLGGPGARRATAVDRRLRGRAELAASAPATRRRRPARPRELGRPSAVEQRRRGRRRARRPRCRAGRPTRGSPRPRSRRRPRRRATRPRPATPAGAPRRTITSGRERRRRGRAAGRRRRPGPCAGAAPRPAACGSASTGQPERRRRARARRRPSTGAGARPRSRPGGRRGRRPGSMTGSTRRRRRWAPRPTAPVGRGPGAARPASPTSGSRNARLRCTGPGRGARWPRRRRGRPATATGRAAASSATPGSSNQRTDRPYRCVWSMVCGRADVVQLGRPVGGAHEQRHARPGRPRPPRGAARRRRCRWW